MFEKSNKNFYICIVIKTQDEGAAAPSFISPTFFDR